MRNIMVMALGIFVLGITSAQATDDLIFGFCYALHASGNCGALHMRLDTEGKVEAKVGGEFRATGDHHPACSDGMLWAFEDQERWRRAEGRELGEQRFCQQAWDDYGCSGAKVPGLLYHRDAFCEYE